jgi:alpha-1,2-mannosyltransferase
VLTHRCPARAQGYAFAYPLAAAAGARVACYTHYPMVSSDMLRAVASRAPAFNNAPRVARSRALSAAKLRYYRGLAALYGAAGRCAHASLVNSSWTAAHISEIWDVEPATVFPPCDTSALRALPLVRAAAPRTVISVAQFRPEKAHATQLHAWAALRQRADAAAAAGDAAAAAALRAARLLLVGGVRHAADAARLEALRALAERLGVSDSVRFAVGVPSAELRALLGAAHIGLHTMRDEHFGISVVEYMAAGAVPVAHDSAGPRADIVVPRGGAAAGGPRPGRLADSEAGFADALAELIVMPEEERLALAQAARDAAGRFSEEAFAAGFLAALRAVLPRGDGDGDGGKAD